MGTKRFAVWLHVGIVACVIALDQLSKEFLLRFNWAVLGPKGRFLTIDITRNTGVTWSLLDRLGDHQQPILIMIIVLVLGWFLLFAVRKFNQKKSAVPEMLIFGGGVANLIDRISRGGVIDFLSCHIGSWYWPTFNIADTVIFVGIVWLIIGMVRKN